MTLRLSSDFQSKLYKHVQKLAEISNHSYCIVDAKYRIIKYNDKFCELTGYDETTLLNTNYLRLLENTKKGYLENIEKRFKEGKLTRAHLVHRRKKTASFYAEIDCVPVQNERNETVFILLFTRDVTHTQLQNFMARIEQELYKAIQDEKSFIEKLELICNGIDSMFYQTSLTSIAIKESNYIHLIQSNSVSDNKSVIKLERPREIHFYNNIINQNEIIIYDYVASLPLYKPLIEYANDKKLHCCALIPISKPDGKKIGLISILFSEQYINDKVYFKFFEKLVDLIRLAHTYELKQREVYQLAYFDPYIGIVNRQGFIEKVKEFADESREGYIQLIEPGEFSRIVELYGRDTGENLLKQICDRIYKFYNVDSMFIGKFSSSAIILYIPTYGNSEKDIEQYIKNVVKHPFSIAEKNFYVTLKSGIAKLEKFDLIEDTIRFSERALTLAKNYSGTYTAFYVKRDDEELERELEILNELMVSIEKKEFQAFLQPKIELHRGRIYGFEALARWHSSKLGNISPVEFIPIAERAGLVRAIDLQIIESVLKWFQQRQYNGKKILPVAINISPEHFYHPDFVDHLIELVQKYYADPKYITIEITEGIGLIDIERAAQILKRLVDYGFSTSVDDFGIGYSSLSYLQKLKFTEMKIDKSFTSRIEELGTHAIVKAIVTLAHSLYITTVAEGVETEQQQKILKDLGVEIVQGYYHYKPLPYADVEQLID